jgi:chemotaxis response regulator CheB
MTYDFFIVAIGSSAGGLPPLKDISSIIPVKAEKLLKRNRWTSIR